MFNGSVHWEARVLSEGSSQLLGWNVPAEELIHIPEHWLIYPEPNPSLHYLLGILYILFTFIALLGNGLVIWIFCATIARPLEGKLSRGQVMLFIVLIWTYTIPWTLMPLMHVWGRFVPEGFLTSCSFDYLTETPEIQYFVATIFTFSYCIPMVIIIYYYSQIVSHVVNHEKALREQAKKMNVESLRSNTNTNAQTAEIRIAKAAITISFLFVLSWTPYGVLAMIGAFGNKALLTPGVTMIPACTCKFVACLDPYVYAISHPRYRLELQKRLPWLELQEKSPADTQSSVTESVNVSSS
ncbi:opsin, ultraviolet-sensitive isoform X3 [Solenopsis invicta]|uniref:opsin, ultraviolet-sensitive isoform X3 n=1 Tax=Solenopsis invicta TaxID=13686 RepID=UPI00193E8C6D|nr:opsin, ultraviolet-sensitive isoform X3 [Solenopsis invicta]